MTTTTGRRALTTTADLSVERRALLADTDRCVKCALCLPVCPTYQTERVETLSPRGRISIVQGLAKGQITPREASPALDSCLACRACERVCPAKVPYGSILDRARAQMATQAPRPVDRRVTALLRSPVTLRVLSTLQRWSRPLPLPKRLRRWRAMTDAPRANIRHIDTNAERGVVYLAGGCVTQAFDAAANVSLAALFKACGFQVETLTGCCGALAQHGGELKQAQQLARALAKQATDTAAPIVHAATGCAAALRDAGDKPATGFGARVVDPFDLLLDAGIKDHLDLAATHYVRVALHRPCTQRNVLGGGDALRALIDELGLPVTELSGVGCCGAAGTHMLTHPSAARALGKAMLEPVFDATPPDVLISSNIGCAWHLRGLLFDEGTKLNVEHPAVFLARFLKTR
ncbi:MAG: (Fe-S)-binding protein [Gammaproteobacteria bacterium]